MTGRSPLARLTHDVSGVCIPMSISGQSRSGAAFESVNPFTGRGWALVADGTDTDVDDAVCAARVAADDGRWSGLPAATRGRLILTLARLIEDNVDDLARMETLDTGKTFAETSRQVAFAARVFRYYAEIADKIDGSVRSVDDPAMVDLVTYEPFGVCALILAWNSPLQLLANKLPAALAAGNTAVVRPSEMAPASVGRFGELVCDSELPAGVVNVVTGRDRHTAERLIQHRDVDLVSITGGVATGRAVAGIAGNHLKKVVAELGGKSAQLVFADADISAAVDGVIAGVFAAAGQTCIAGSRLLVERSAFDQVVSLLVERAERIRLGDPFDSATDMGPMANEAQYRRVLTKMENGIAEARLISGGVHDSRTRDLFLPPTIFTDVGETSALVQDEVFGPVLVAMPFEDEDDAVRAANATPFGLAAGLWTTDLSRAVRVAKRMRCGTVWVNTYRRVEASAPFGGFKQSGLGRERGLEGLREYMQTKNIMIRIAS